MTSSEICYQSLGTTGRYQLGGIRPKHSNVKFAKESSVGDDDVEVD
ncbi:MAG: hypothetical protein OEY31_15345 [Candidatus Bathyarchaeota archaeon]|nr:hypothetical protein [Candidatus Bathyarchaeota archaeon]